MLTMTQVHNIRKLYFEEGKNISQISKETGFDRKTVGNFLKKDDFNKPLPPAVYVAGYPKLNPFKSEIDNWLCDDKKAKPKQRHTAKRVFDRLRNKYSGSFNCSYRTVAGYVAYRKKEIFTKKVGVLPLEHIAGEAQLLFEVVSECYERKPIIINTKIEFSRWVSVFYDEQMTGAIIDRLLHHCHLLLFPGPSNRMRESSLK